MPAASTTVGARTSPSTPSCNTRTPTARPFSTTMSLTSVFSKMCAPPCLAPLAYAMVVSTGLVCPSLGVHSPPTTPLSDSSGYLESTSEGVRNSTSTPKARPMAPVRLNSSKRAAFSATATEPFCLNPVAWPVSASSVLSNSDVYLASSVSVRVARSCGTSPAACQVVPQVSCRRSSSTTSRMPSLVRW